MKPLPCWQVCLKLSKALEVMQGEEREQSKQHNNLKLCKQESVYENKKVVQ